MSQVANDDKRKIGWWPQGQFGQWNRKQGFTSVVKAITDSWRRKSQSIVLVATDTNINTAPRPSSDKSRRL